MAWIFFFELFLHYCKFWSFKIALITVENVVVFLNQTRKVHQLSNNVTSHYHEELSYREREGGGKKERCIGYVISLNLGTPNFRYIELITAWNFSLGKKNSPRAGLCCGISNILKNPNGHSCFLGYPLGVEWKGRKPGSGLLVR